MTWQLKPLIFFQFFEYSRHVLWLGPFPWLFILPRSLFLQGSSLHTSLYFLMSLISLLQCHLLKETYPWLPYLKLKLSAFPTLSSPYFLVIFPWHLSYNIIYLVIKFIVVVCLYPLTLHDQNVNAEVREHIHFHLFPQVLILPGIAAWTNKEKLFLTEGIWERLMEKQGCLYH